MADRHQQQVIRQIVQIGKKRGMPREAILSALATGSVESRFRNLDYGHADSEGWRQERRQYYRNPRNVKASVNRYYDEWLADANPSQSIGEQAQAVQQSAFPDRYRTRVPLAKRLLRRYGGSNNAPGHRSVTTRIPGVDNSDLRQSLMQQYLLEREEPDALLNLGLGLRDAQDIPGRTVRRQLPADSGRKVLTGSGVPVNDMLRKAVKWDRAKAPYLWGGGHASIAKPGQPVDCSGFVSAVLGLKRPMVSGELMHWGKPGEGRHVTVYANEGHVLMRIGNRWFGTSQSNPGGGAGEIPKPSKEYLSRFVARHPG